MPFRKFVTWNLDLFSGCGGISYGFESAGLRTLAAVDKDSKAIDVLRYNLPDIPYVLCEDLTEFGPEYLSRSTGITEIDVIAGGPPCQGYSTFNRFNHGRNKISVDSRRTLYQHFLEYVDYFRPTIFFMENVLGIFHVDNGIHFANLRTYADSLGYDFIYSVVNAVNYGIPQNRSRVLCFGLHSSIKDKFPYLGVGDILRDSQLSLWSRHDSIIEDSVTLFHAIGDLPELAIGSSSMLYDQERRSRHYQEFPNSKYLKWVLDDNDELTAHVSRSHNDRDLRDFARLRPGEKLSDAIGRGEEIECPYNLDVFSDKYYRLVKDKPSRIILSHLSRDGLMYIHPTQTRSLTPREAARLQSFPDKFRFPVSMSSQFRLIGNAVPPLLAKRIGDGIINLLEVT